MTYDLIGDVHGQFSKLKSVFEHLGYKKHNNLYSKKKHKAIFIGDLVDRGSHSREVIDLVKNMVEEGCAEAIMGNHEYNLFGYLTRGKDGSFLRQHSAKNNRQVKETLKSYEGHDKMLRQHLKWIAGLPLYINKPEFRAVHACWDKDSIGLIKNLGGRRLTKEVLVKSYECGSELERAVKMILSGPEITLPQKMVQHDIDGNKRHNIRYKWWEQIQEKTYHEAAIKDVEMLPNEKILLPAHFKERDYAGRKKPLFFGHYSMKGKPGLMKPNVCCLDWINKKNRIAVYQFHGEQELEKENLKYFY